MSDAPPPTRTAWHVKIDLRDVLGAGGALLVLGGAASIHWGVALAVVGAALFALAYRLSR